MKKAYTFVNLEQGVEPQEFDTFKEAFTAMSKCVNELSNKGQLTLQFLETAIWIEVAVAGLRSPIFFYDARDKAIDEGILVDGNLV